METFIYNNSSFFEICIFVCRFDINDTVHISFSIQLFISLLYHELTRKQLRNTTLMSNTSAFKLKHVHRTTIFMRHTQVTDIIIPLPPIIFFHLVHGNHLIYNLQIVQSFDKREEKKSPFVNGYHEKRKKKVRGTCYNNRIYIYNKNLIIPYYYRSSSSFFHLILDYFNFSLHLFSFSPSI